MFMSQTLNLYYSALKYVIYLFASSWNEIFKKIPVIKRFVFSTHSLAVGFCIYSHLLQKGMQRRWLSKALTYEYSKVSLAVLLLLLGYLLSGSWYPSSVGYGFCLKEWTLSQIRYWLVMPTSFFFWPTMLQHTLQEEHPCRPKGLWLAWCLHFSVGSTQSTFLYQRNQQGGAKALCRSQPNFPMFSELCGCCLQQEDLVSVCGEQPIVS